MTPMTPINVALPAQTMTVEALEALIAAAKAAVPKPFVPEVGQRVRLTRDNDFGGAGCGRKGDTGVVQEKSWSLYTNSKECRVDMDNGIGRMIVKWDGLELAPAPTPRYAVGDYAVYALGASPSAGWGVVQITAVLPKNCYRAVSITTPAYGTGAFNAYWLRPATEDEIAAATRITPCYAKLLKRKSDGQVLRLWERCGEKDSLVPAWWVDAVDSNQWAFPLAESAMTTRDYDVLASYLLKGA